MQEQNDNKNMLNDAITLVKAGQSTNARKLLESCIDANPQDVTAWLWKAKSWPSIEDRIKVLEMCLAHNPGDKFVTDALITLTRHKNRLNSISH